MAVPGFQSLMLPLLKMASDKEKHDLSEALTELSASFNLTSEDMEEELGRSKHNRFHNRVGWARTYLKKAGLIEYPGQGEFQITKRGLEVLESNPIEINIHFLCKFPEFREFTQSARDKAKRKSGRKLTRK